MLQRRTAITPNIEKYSLRAVPRYTSYPTAPHFHEGVNGKTSARWLSKLDVETPVSLYLHVPYCKQACWYCGCNMKLASRYEPIGEYAKTLRAELRLLASRLPGRMKLSHIAWGGGTPTAFKPVDLAHTMDLVRELFEVLPDAEIAIESDPRTLAQETVETIGLLGFTRASFGIQEFDPRVQAAINRVQPPEMVASAVQALREAGVSAVNFDLIYGLPHHTVETLVSTVETCAGLAPDRFALFGYAHVPWAAKRQRMIPEEALPGLYARMDQARAAADALKAAGYVRIGMDHFARPGDELAKAERDGTLRRNFQGYTTDTAETLLGVGASSIGRTPSGYVQNITETGAWSRAVEAGTLPVARGVALSREDRIRSQVIEELMCRGTVDLDAVARTHNAPGWYLDDLPALAPMVEDGIAVLEGARLTLTDTGAPLVRVVAAVFDSYLEGGRARHSVAV